MANTVLTAREMEPLLDWAGAVEALEAGHRRPRADIGDLIQKRDDDTLLTRSAWIDGLGMAVKSVSIFPARIRASKGSSWSTTTAPGRSRPSSTARC